MPCIGAVRPFILRVDTLIFALSLELPCSCGHRVSDNIVKWR